MLRRVVCVLLLPCVLLTQSAALGHAHATTPTGKAPRPHFHTGLTSLGHDHHHGPGGQHHHDAEDELPHEQLPDHDEDAVFLNAVDAVVTGWVLTDADTAAAFPVVPDLGQRAAFAPVPLTAASHRPHPPPDDGLPCPLHVRHRALLI